MRDRVATSSPGEFRALIRPNCSMSPRAAAVVVICFAVLALAIALSFVTLGLWVVFPFAGLEILALGLIFATVAKRSEDYDLVIVDAETVTVTQHRGGAEELKRFQRHWTRVRFEPGATRFQIPRLLIGSHGEFVEIGASMTQDAKERLADRLRHAVRADRVERS